MEADIAKIDERVELDNGYNIEFTAKERNHPPRPPFSQNLQALQRKVKTTKEIGKTMVGHLKT